MVKKIFVAIIVFLCIAAIMLSFIELPVDEAQETTASVDAGPASTPAPTPPPTPTPKPTPAPVPQPAPLNIAKNEKLPFSALAPTTTMTFEELVGDNGIYNEEDKIPPPPPPDTYRIVVDEYHQLATVYKQDENGDYTVPVRYMVTTSGSYSTPTIKGTFNMAENYVRFGLFSCGVWGQYWRQITRAFYFHSLLYSRHSANSYTNSYNKLGTRASHGCVRLYVPDARWLYYNCPPGTVVEIKRGDKDDTATAAIKAMFDYPEKPKDRPGLKPGQIPVTEAWPGWSGDAYDAYVSTLPETQDEIAFE